MPETTEKVPQVYNLTLTEDEAMLLGLHSIIGVAVMQGDTASAGTTVLVAMMYERALPKEVRQSYAQKMLTLYKLVRQRTKEKA